MAHELETQNGVASFASFREPAWHGLGTVFTEEKTTAEMLSSFSCFTISSDVTLPLFK